MSNISLLLQGAAAQLDAARDAASDVVGNVGSQLGDSAAGAIDSLPPPVRDALSAAAAPVSQVSKKEAAPLPCLKDFSCNAGSKNRGPQRPCFSFSLVLWMPEPPHKSPAPERRLMKVFQRVWEEQGYPVQPV